MKTLRDNRGFTIIEMIVTLTLFTILSVVLAQLYVETLIQYRNNDTRSKRITDYSTDLTNYSAQLTLDVKSAYKMSDGGTGQPGNDYFVNLSVPAVDASDNLLYNADGTFKTDTITYIVQNQTSELWLYKSIGPAAGSARPAYTYRFLASADLTSPGFSFNNDLASASNQVSWSWAKTYTYRGRPLTTSTARTVTLRNQP